MILALIASLRRKVKICFSVHFCECIQVDTRNETYNDTDISLNRFSLPPCEIAHTGMLRESACIKRQKIVKIWFFYSPLKRHRSLSWRLRTYVASMQDAGAFLHSVRISTPMKSPLCMWI